MVIQLRSRVDFARVRTTIEQAEGRSSGQIVVSIADYFFGNVERATRRTFERLGVANTRHRNGVLLFVVPARRRLEILADEGIHAKVAPGFWDTILTTVVERFRLHDYTAGLVRAIEAIGAELATHFPRDAADRNELPDEPDRYRA